ncbi:hypothetical protein B0H11DRAFT_2289393 [Mycena galericulata]|nr:hypothetical protein B0H11DRAFT_2289393 [Mycena galericulata]
MDTALNQSSMDCFPSTRSTISACIEVAWCTQQRNNARLIPDGAITGVSFLKTDFYVQIIGGELDPHGATGLGNPIGGNVTADVDGIDEPIAEWMLDIDFIQYCFRACTNANLICSAAFMCWHELDVMGCEFVMPGTYNPPAKRVTRTSHTWYPTATVDGTTLFSTFAQFFTGVFTGNDGLPTSYTVGDTDTPTAAFTTAPPTASIRRPFRASRSRPSGIPAPRARRPPQVPALAPLGLADGCLLARCALRPCRGHQWRARRHRARQPHRCHRCHRSPALIDHWCLSFPVPLQALSRFAS